MKVAILTMFNSLSNAFSVANMVAEQLRMLLDHDIHTKVLVCEHCPDGARHGVFLDERIEWAKVVNQKNGQRFRWHDYALPYERVHDSFFEEAALIAENLVEHLSDVDVCFLHDIHHVGPYLVHNVAVRKAQEQLPNVRFIAFTHSAPIERPLQVEWPFSARFSPMAHTIYVYPTQSGISALARQYDVPEGMCRVVHNCVDILNFMTGEANEIAMRTNLLASEIGVVYPGRLTPQKKFDKVASLCGCIKRASRQRVQVVFCDYLQADVDDEIYKTFVRSEGSRYGLEAQDMVFTSDLGYPRGVPRKTVLELFSLSKLFICPSFSESFGLTVLEAASQGNFLVLNERVPALEELGRQMNAYFMRWDAWNFGYETKESYQPSEQGYLESHAAKIVMAMKENPVIRAKTMATSRYSPQWIWHNQLEPLLRPWR